MDPTSAKQLQRKELQGPRPTPLKIRKDSHKIKKPPMAPPQPQPAPAAPVQYKPPVIIYAVSPKVIHTKPSEFMSLVQRLTGSSSSSTSASTSSIAPATLPAPTLFPSPLANIPSPFPYTSYLPPGFLSGTGMTPIGGGISPAARLAAIEHGIKDARTESPASRINRENDLILSQLGIETEPTSRLEGGLGFSPAGILSPVPSSLPIFSPNLFSPLIKNSNDQGGSSNNLGFLQELSPVFNYSNRSLLNNDFFANTPGSFFSNTPTNNFLSISTPQALQPSPSYWDLFHHYQNL